jgi:hypothetical protein
VLAGRARQVRLEHERIRGVDHGCLGRPVEQVGRVLHQVLVERVVLRNEHRERRRRPPPGPPGLLPHRGSRPRVADENGGVEGADVDPQLQRVRGRDGDQLVARELALELAAVLWQVAGPVGLDLALELAGQLAARELGQELGGAPGPREPDRFHALLGQAPHEDRRVGQRAPARARLLVDHRRVPEREDLAAGGGGVLDDGVERQADEPLGQLRGVADRRARQHEPRLAAVVRHEAAQPAQHHRDVRAEHAARDVRLVDDDQRKPQEEVGPARVIRQDRGVQHVGVRHDQVRVAADQRALGLRRVAVVHRGL